MTIVKIEANDNGSHNNQTINGVTVKEFPVPDGWAVVPEDLETPNFPFGDITVEERMHHVEEEITEEAELTPPLVILVMTVTSWTPLPIPAPEPGPEPEPTQMDRVEAQATYTAMMTNTLLEEV